MNRSLILACLCALSGVAVHAETPDPSGQFAHNPASSTTRAGVTADCQADRQETAAMTREDSGSVYVSPRFESTRTRAEVRNQFLTHRAEVAAMTGEDSGSAYLAAHKVVDDGRRFAAGESPKTR